MLAVGNRVGDYEIVTRLRAGGMATLFLARRTGASGFSKPVVIKVIHTHLASDDAFVRMFVDEAHLSARIQHPNVVHVEELREIDGQLLLVMEYVPGASLSQLLYAVAQQGRRMTPELAVLIAIRVAEGLHAAHETRGADGQLLGVVHRDVSPQNVLLAYQGHVKLIDFGIARASGRGGETSGSLKGKVRYMAPEQAFGRPVDRRADVYSLALVLWEMLTMRKAFEGEQDLALLERVRHPEKVPPPSALAKDIPEALDRAVLAAMEPDLAKRTPTALAFRRALADALPRALTLDDSHLSDLLAALLPAQMAEERERASESASGVRGAQGAPMTSEEVIGTLTLAQAELLEAKTEISEAPASIGSSPVAQPPAPAFPIHEASSSIAFPRSSSSRAPLVALAAVALVGVGAVTAWAAMKMTRDETPIVTPATPREAPVSPVDPAPVTTTSAAVASPIATDDAGARAASSAIDPAPTTPRPRRVTELRPRPTSRPRPTAPTKTRPGVPLADTFGD